MRDMLRLLAPSFVNLEYQGYKEDFSDAPKYWNWTDLNLIENCRVCEIPSRGCAATDVITWMLHAKNYLNKLIVCKAYVKFKTATGVETEHDTFFDEACNGAIKKAKEYWTEEYESATYTIDHSCEFGSYENNVPYGEDDDEYCSTAEIKTIWDIKNKTTMNMRVIILSFSLLQIRQLIRDSRTNGQSCRELFLITLDLMSEKVLQSGD